MRSVLKAPQVDQHPGAKLMQNTHNCNSALRRSFSVIKSGGPVQDYCDGTRSGVDALVDQEAPPVATGDVVIAVCGHTGGHASLEQRLGNAEGRTGADRNGHEFPIFGKIINFASIRAPAWLVSAVCGDRPPSVGPRKRLDVDFKLARFVRRVRHQVTVWRKIAMQFFGR